MDTLAANYQEKIEQVPESHEDEPLDANLHEANKKVEHIESILK